MGPGEKAKIPSGEQKKYKNIGPFSGGGLEKPNLVRTIDTLADGS